MRKTLYTILFMLLTASCSTQYKLIGSWEEIGYKKEHLTFEENGNMSFDNIKGPIEFKYEIKEKSDNIIKFNIIVYREGIEYKTALHTATFNTSDTIIIKNIDFPEVKENTYHKMKK